MEKTWAVNKLDKNTAEIMLYGHIGGDKVNAADFVAQLKSLESNYKTIRLRVNSGGGSVFEGLAIFNAIRQSNCEIVAYIDGLCASMASIIVLACKKIYMSKVAMLMIHRPSGASVGNPDQLRSTADMLEDLEKSLIGIYAERTGLTADQVKEKYLGSSDNWLTATEAVAAKLIDGVYDAPKPAAPPPATMRAEQDLISYFTNSFNQSTMKDIQLSAEVLSVLGITADAADSSTVNAAIATLASKAEKVNTLTGELATANTKIKEFEDAAIVAKAEKLVDDAIGAKKIVDGDREKYLRLAKADYEGTEQVISGMTPYTSIEDVFNGIPPENKIELETLVKMSGRDLYMQGKLERLKELSLPQFKAKYKELYNKEYEA